MKFYEKLTRIIESNVMKNIFNSITKIKLTTNLKTQKDIMEVGINPTETWNNDVFRNKINKLRGSRKTRVKISRSNISKFKNI